MPAGSLRAAPLVIRIAAVLCWLLAPAAAAAAELLMFEDPGCGYCRRWHAEIGPGYLKSVEGLRAPLRRVDLRFGSPQGVQLNRRITITPTFVLVEDGREVGRVVGYVGADFFYEVLDEVLGRLPRGAAGQAAGGGHR